jgi:flagellar hook-associated protein 2
VISEAVEGVTFTLKNVTLADSPVTISVTPDSDALKKKIEGFVSAYNGILDRLARDGSRNATSGATGSLFGDFTATSIKRRLASTAAGAVTTGDGKYNSLSSIGITTSRTGTLTVDSAKLTKAIESAPESVVALFVDGNGGLAGKFAALANSVSSSTGDIAARETGLKSGVKTIDTQIERFEARLVRIEKQLTTKYAELESYASKFQGLGDLLTSKLASLNN